MGWDVHCCDQVRPLLVQIDRDLDLLINLLLVDLANVDPLEVDERQVAAKGLGELDSLVVRGVLSSLHREPLDDES